jgi:predicted nucleic acid-binding protein
MQRVVSDSDVIIHLAKLNKLDLIGELYECAQINFFSKEKTLTKRVKNNVCWDCRCNAKRNDMIYLDTC